MCSIHLYFLLSKFAKRTINKVLQLCELLIGLREKSIILKKEEYVTQHKKCSHDRDCDDLRREFEQLQVKEELFKTMAESSVDWDVWYAVDGKSIYITPSCEKITGYPRIFFYNNPEFITSIVHPDDLGIFQEHRRLHYVTATGPSEVTFRILHKNGEIRWIWHQCQSVFSANGTWLGRRTTNRDITALKQAEKELQRLSTTDPLTGAYNRRMFMDLLTKEQQRADRYGDPFSLLMFDIDHFKAVNDQYGHDAGDRVLVEIVRLSMETIRQTDALARWGGEEFMVLLPKTDGAMARTMGERLRQGIAGHAFTNSCHLTISVGFTGLEQTDTIDSLLKRVDEAMYKAKKSGRNLVVEANNSEKDY